jgi:hypothetical protein
MRSTHDHAERYERLRQGAEALGLLKPQETRALQLRAEGFSYAEICEITGWSYTNVAVYPSPAEGGGETTAAEADCGPSSSRAAASTWS